MTGKTGIIDRALFWRHGNQKAVRQGEWKLVVSGVDGSDPELFNLENDLGESNNLASTHPDIVRELQEQLTAWERDVSS